MKLKREELAAESNAFVQGILDRIQLDLHSVASVDDEGVKLNIEGADVEALLTDNARLLYALNHLVNQIFYRRSRDGCNFLIDCGNYRLLRGAELELMADKAAEKVRYSGRKVSLQPMPSGERRIIHLRLAGQQGVRTESEGAGRRRRVLIVPAR
jgi:spoIIIJ-associated protein